MNRYRFETNVTLPAWLCSSQNHESEPAPGSSVELTFDEKTGLSRLREKPTGAKLTGVLAKARPSTTG